MRKLLAAMKISLDSRMEGPEGYADWVDAWSEDYGLTPHIDACVLGAAMYRGYEPYWTGVLNEPEKPHWLGDALPTPAELEWAHFAARTPHYVLSSTQTAAQWPNTTFIRGTDDVAALKEGPGKDIYLMGGAATTAGLIDAGLVDELRLIVHPLVAGEGKGLFATTQRRRELELRAARQLPNGRLLLNYLIRN